MGWGWDDLWKDPLQDLKNAYDWLERGIDKESNRIEDDIDEMTGRADQKRAEAEWERELKRRGDESIAEATKKYQLDYQKSFTGLSTNQREANIRTSTAGATATSSTSGSQLGGSDEQNILGV